MTNYKLSYFNLRTRGETARMLFKLAGIEFTDNRIASEDWPKIKPTLPMGQLPLLEVDGVPICQSGAINRYLARKFGYAGKTDLEMAQIEMIGDSVEDCTAKLLRIYELKGDEKEAYKKTYRSTVFEPYLQNMQSLLERNNGGNGFFFGDSLTYPDMLFINIYDYVSFMMDAQDAIDNYPKLKAHRERVESVPAIAKWIKERPQTAF